MRLDDDFEDNYENEYDDYNTRKNTSTLYTAVAVGVVFLAVILCVLVANNTGTKKVASNSVNDIIQNTEDMHKQQMDSQKSVDELLTGSTLTAQDLDIWDDYPNTSNYNNNESIDFSESDDEVEEEKTDPSTDGLHTLIIYEDGKEEWVEINKYLEPCQYNFNNLVYQQPLMKYYADNKKISHVGIDISKTDEYVDFVRLKNAGIDYVIIRMGQRGYYSGELTMDDCFEDNLKRAIDAGLQVGLYFYSQATTKDEAIEEAEFVLTSLSLNSASENGVIDDSIKSKVRYPIIFRMESVKGDEARTDSLTQMERTYIAMAFMDTIKEAGYSTMLYGTKEWLIKKYSLGTLDGYDIWLSEEGDIPTFPYEFQMWNYTKHGKINGIPSDASLSISFIDYSVR